MACKLDTIRVLKLNKSWAPIGIVSAFDAICKVANGKAKFLDSEYNMYNLESWAQHWSDISDLTDNQKNRLVHTARMCFLIPEIIVLTEYNGFINQKVKMNRRNIYERDAYICQYCGKRFNSQDLNLDHVMPRSRGGKTTWKNIVTSCIECNNRKGNRTPNEAGMILLRKPVKPHWLTQGRKFRFPKSWEDFLGQLYWDVQLED